MSYSFHGLMNVGAMNIFGYLETVRHRFGLNSADIWNGFLSSYDPSYIKMIKENIDERGLTVVNFACDEAHIWDNDLEKRNKYEENSWKCIETAEIMGAKSVRIDAGIRENEMSDEQLDYVSKKYREYCKKAASFGARLGTENHWGATKVKSNIDKLFEAVNENNFGILLHLGRWTEDDPVKKEAIDLALIGRAMHVHISVEVCTKAEKILPPLPEAGYNGCWSIEAGNSVDEYNTAAYMLAKIKSVLCPLSYDGKWKDGPPSVNG